MSELLGKLERGLIFIVSAPAGTGKTTLVDMLCAEFPSGVERSISCTTREGREGETHGEHYHFITSQEFEKYKQEDAFVEYAEVFGAFYGTLKSEIERITSCGKHVFLVIDTQGAAQLMASLDEAVYIFIRPPSMDELERRLESRNSESAESLKKRLNEAEKELEQSSVYDYHICNDDLQTAYQVLKSIVIAEEHKNRGKLT